MRYIIRLAKSFVLVAIFHAQEEKKTLKEKFQTAQEVTAMVQNVLGDIASLGERIKKYEFIKADIWTNLKNISNSPSS